MSSAGKEMFQESLIAFKSVLHLKELPIDKFSLNFHSYLGEKCKMRLKFL